MNLKNKKRVSNPLIVLVLIVTSILFQGCSDEIFKMDDINRNTNEFIEIEGDLNDVRVLMDTENRIKYKRAVNRVLSKAEQHGNKISYSINNGADVNISERLFYRITENNSKLIESEKFILYNEKGQNVIAAKRFVRKTIRLKSDQVESGEEEYISGDLSGDNTSTTNSIIDGFENYDNNENSSMNDLWDMDSYNWGTSAQNSISNDFSIGGYEGAVFMSSGCDGDQNCTGNNINNAYYYWDDVAGEGYFELNDDNNLPLAVIRMDDEDGFDYMKERLGW